MSFDIGFHGAIKDFALSWLEGRGQTLIYMPRFYSSHNKGLCYRCVDLDEKVETDPNCPVCFGTGYIGGWDAPITGINSPYQRVYGLFSYNNVLTDWQQTGVVSEETDQKLTIATVSQPQLSDLIIDPDGNRYLVSSHVTDWTFNGDHIGWHITVSQVGTDNVVYKVPVPALNAILSIGGNNYSNQVMLELILPTEIFIELDY